MGVLYTQFVAVMNYAYATLPFVVTAFSVL